MSAFKPLGQLIRAAQDALEQRVKNDQEGVVLQQAAVWGRAITIGLMGTTALALAWLAFAQTEEIVQAPGKLEPVGSVKEVQMPMEGVTKDILVKEGEHVRAGQVLIRLDTESSLERRSSVLQTIALKHREISLKLLELERTRELATTKLSVLEESLKLLKTVESRYRKLTKQGAISDIQLLDQQDKITKTKGDISSTKADLNRQESILQQNIQELSGQVAELESKLTDSQVTLRYQAIKAPVSGVVFDLQPKGPGYVAQGSQPVLKIVPYDKLKAKVEIESSNIGFVSVGKPADISIDSFPANDFGVLTGTVTKIGSDALPPDQAKNKTTYRFPADITLSRQTLKLKNGTILPLQVGMSLSANIKLRKVSYLQLLLSDFKNKADSLRKI